MRVLTNEISGFADNDTNEISAFAVNSLRVT